MLKEQSHLGPTCDERPGRKHIWLTTEHGHDICVDCKITRPTPKPRSLKDQWLDAAMLRILERPSLDAIFKYSAPHNHLALLTSMPTVVWMIRKEYTRIANAACKEPTIRVASITGKIIELPDIYALGTVTDPRSRAQ